MTDLRDWIHEVQQFMTAAERDRRLALFDEMLEALKLATDYLEHSTQFKIGNPGFEKAQCLARSIIAKAENKDAS